MSRKKPEAQQPPSIDQMNLKDLASLFCMTGLLASVSPDETVDPKRAVAFCDRMADEWVAQRSKP